MSFLVEDLVESVKRRSFAPISQATFQDADLIDVLNEEISSTVVPELIKLREDFFFWRKTESLVTGKTKYLIPNNVIGGSIKALFYVEGDSKVLLTRRDIEDLGNFSSTGTPNHFYFEGDEVGLFSPPATATGSLLWVYPRRPNLLVATSSCAKISSVSSAGGTTTFTVDTDLTASLSVGSKIDFVRGTSPFLLWAEQVSITAITTTTIAVATSAVLGEDGSTVEPEATDYICPAGYSCIPMLPVELHPWLAQCGAVEVLASLGDSNKVAIAESRKERLLQRILPTMKNRAESAPDMFVKANAMLRAFRS